MKAIIWSAFACGLSLASPASAAYLADTWTGTISSGSVTSQDGSGIDGFADGDYSGQTFTAHVYHSTTGESVFDFASLTVGNNTFGITGTGLAYYNLADFQNATGVSNILIYTNGFSNPFDGADKFDFGYVRELSLFAPVPDAPHFYLDYPYFASGFLGTGTALICEGATPYCLDFNLAPTSLSIAEAAPVPEPATWSFLIAGFALIGAAMRRRTKLTRVIC